MINEFSRTELLLGEESMNRLKNAKVMVLGVGGVGSHCIEALARAGVGQLILVDNDTVSLTNINRQSIAFHSTVGKYKTKVMEEKIKDIHPACQVRTYEMFVLPENMDELFGESVDYIIDAENNINLLEVNTTPGMTATSFIPQQVRAAGLDIADVMTEIIENEFLR